MKTLLYDQIVIGNNLQAMYFAFINDFPLIINSSHNYYVFDHFTTRGSLLDEYEKMYFILGLLGLNKFNEMVTNIFFESENTIIVTTNQLINKFEIRFNKCHVFDDENIVDNEFMTPLSNPIYRVIDRFSMKNNLSDFGTETQRIVTGHEFPHMITFEGSNERSLMKQQGIRGPQEIRWHRCTSFWEEKDFKNELSERWNLKFEVANSVPYKCIGLKLNQRYIQQLRMSKYNNTNCITFHYKTVWEMLTELEEYVWGHYLEDLKKIRLLKMLTKDVPSKKHYLLSNHKIDNIHEQYMSKQEDKRDV